MSSTVKSLSPFPRCYASQESFDTLGIWLIHALASQSMLPTPPLEEWRLWPPGMPKDYQYECAVVFDAALWKEKGNDPYSTAYNSVYQGLEESHWELVGREPLGTAFGAPVCRSIDFIYFKRP
jgi:hypothetical protein